MLENKCHVFRTAWTMELWSSLRWEEIVTHLRFAVYIDKCVDFDTPPPLPQTYTRITCQEANNTEIIFIGSPVFGRPSMQHWGCSPSLSISRDEVVTSALHLASEGSIVCLYSCRAVRSSWSSVECQPQRRYRLPPELWWRAGPLYIKPLRCTAH